MDTSSWILVLKQLWLYDWYVFVILDTSYKNTCVYYLVCWLSRTRISSSAQTGLAEQLTRSSSISTWHPWIYPYTWLSFIKLSAQNPIRRKTPQPPVEILLTELTSRVRPKNFIAPPRYSIVSKAHPALILLLSPRNRLRQETSS